MSFYRANKLPNEATKHSNDTVEDNFSVSTWCANQQYCINDLVKAIAFEKLTPDSS